MNRRKFMLTVVAGACAASSAAQLLAGAADAPIKAGRLADFVGEGVYDTLLKSNGIILVSTGGKLIAMGSACTHRGAELDLHLQNKRVGAAAPYPLADASFVCSRHGAKFGSSGQVLKGPAKQPLGRRSIKLSGDEVIVSHANVAAGDPDFEVELPRK